MAKIDLKKALDIHYSIRWVMNEVYQEKKYDINHDAVINLVNLYVNYNGRTTIKNVKERVLKRHKKLNLQHLEVKISKSIKQLEDIGAVAKEKDPSDKRICVIAITEKGKDIAKYFWENIKELWEVSNV